MIGYHGYHDYHVNDQDDDLSLVAGYVRCPDVAVADLLQVLIFQDWLRFNICYFLLIHCYPLSFILFLARSMVIGKMKWVVKKSNPTEKNTNLVNSSGKMRGRVRSKHVHRQEKVIPGTCDVDDDDLLNLTSLI